MCFSNTKTFDLLGLDFDLLLTLVFILEDVTFDLAFALLLAFDGDAILLDFDFGEDDLLPADIDRVRFKLLQLELL